MREELGKVQLRNEYSIFELTAGYEVYHRDRRGQTFSQIIPSNIVESAHAELAGNDWRVKDAADRLHVIASDQDWPFSFGYKLQFFVQAILVVLVAVGRAEYEGEERGFLYTVHGL